MKDMPPEALDMLSAAFRHLECAQNLLATSPDEAWYLAGYVPECTRKAVISSGEFLKIIGHDPGSRILNFVIAGDVEAHRAGVDQWSMSESWGKWSPEHRYDRTSEARKVTAATLVAEAENRLWNVVVSAWTDGRIRELPR